jgi:hypothetical protein
MNQNVYYEIILNIMRRERKDYWESSHGKYPHRMPTFYIKMLFNKESVLEATGPDMFRAMKYLCKQGYVIKHPDSRIGQAYWQLTEKVDAWTTQPT